MKERKTEIKVCCMCVLKLSKWWEGKSKFMLDWDLTLGVLWRGELYRKTFLKVGTKGEGERASPPPNIQIYFGHEYAS